MSNDHDAPRNDEPRPDDLDRADAPRIDDGTQHEAPRSGDAAPAPVQHDAPRIDDGAPAQHDAPRVDDAPRYGERITPSPASAPAAADATPTEAYRPADQPAYGERTTDQPAYGERSADATPTQAYGTPAAAHGEQQYGAGAGAQHGSAHDGSWPDQQPTQQYGQQWGGTNADHTTNQHPADHHGGYQQAAPVYGQPNGGAWQSYDEPKPVVKKKTVGVVAFVVALLALVAGIVAAFVFGNAFGASQALRDFAQNNANGSISPEQQEELRRQVMSDPATAAQFGVAGLLFLVGTVLGLWAIVQGIIAAVAKRGRAFGVLAIILAVVAAIASFIVLGSVAASKISGL
jgi:hypothetical protein